MRLIAETIGEKLGIRCAGSSRGERRLFRLARDVRGPDNPTSSAITRVTLGWQPTGVGLIEDMRANDLG